ncbi:MAG: hypothetical protein LPK21_00515, partial [Hymenobacteraceae bacterium]|nr:hypothetical protein [Hymenobacteraceae bacterium]
MQAGAPRIVNTSVIAGSMGDFSATFWKNTTKTAFGSSTFNIAPKLVNCSAKKATLHAKAIHCRDYRRKCVGQNHI